MLHRLTKRLCSLQGRGAGRVRRHRAIREAVHRRAAGGVEGQSPRPPAGAEQHVVVTSASQEAASPHTVSSSVLLEHDSCWLDSEPPASCYCNVCHGRRTQHSGRRRSWQSAPSSRTRLPCRWQRRVSGTASSPSWCTASTASLSARQVISRHICVHKKRTQSEANSRP